MSPDSLFSICTFVVLPGWLLLVFAPRWNWSARLISAVVIPVPLALVYLHLVSFHLWDSKGGFGSLEEVGLAFENPYILLAGWIHYLAFDLFIGSWEVREAQRAKIHHLLVVPSLILTFLLGPAGLLLFLGMRFALRRKIALG